MSWRYVLILWVRWLMHICGLFRNWKGLFFSISKFPDEDNIFVK